MLSPLTHDDPADVAAYRLLARLGSGGMGTVYLARTPGGRTVALKTVHARLATDPAFRARFRLETDAARIIGARHGAAVVDADPLAETPWLATEYVLGPPLDDAVALGGPLPEPTVRALGAALAGALAQLHSSDVVHRDLKPSNVLVTAYGPKIIDFGIARAAGDEHLTRTGAAAGTPAFMSPEQASGQEHPPAGDVFALAGVLVFAATGHGPFGTGSAADLLYRVRYADPDLTGVPEALLPLLTACLSKDPEARPTTGDLIDRLHDGHGEFADHLPPLLLTDIARRATDVWLHAPHRLPAPAESAVAETTPGTPISRRRLLSAGGAALLGVAGAGGGAWTWLRSRDDEGGTGTGTGSVTATGPTAIPATTAPTALPRPCGRARCSTASRRPSPARRWCRRLRRDGLLPGRVPEGQHRTLDRQQGLGAPADHHRRHVLLRRGRARRRSGPTPHPYARPLTGEETARMITLKGFDGAGRNMEVFTVSGGILYATARRGSFDDPLEKNDVDWHMFAVDLRTGKFVWRFAYDWDGVRPWLSSIVGDRLILGKNSGDLESFLVQARDLRTGRQLWQRRLPLEDSSWYIPGQLTTDDKHVYVGGDRLRALRVTDGRIAWEFGSGTRSTEYGVPVLADGLVHVNKNGVGIVAVSADKGLKRWEEVYSGRSLTPSLFDKPVVGEKYVYAPVQGGLSAVDRTTHVSDWVFPTDATRFVVDKERKRIVGAGKSSVMAIPYV